MSGLSKKLKGYGGGNPFRESQARNYGYEQLAREFYPTQLFWSLFNHQHEILLGTRGSGKTAILKMLSYTCLKGLSADQAKEYVSQKSFIGFYVPMHLEFAMSIRGLGGDIEEQQTRFTFGFNCVAAKALLTELETLVREKSADARALLVGESAIVDELMKAWDCVGKVDRPSLASLRWTIDVMYTRRVAMKGEELVKECGAFATSLFAPIEAVLFRIMEILHLDMDKTTWIACVDEAEFLPPDYLLCINTFMRSAKKPLVVKMATLPFGHSTRDTLVPGVAIQASGNDFHYQVVDTDCESRDFEELCDHLTRTRLPECGVPYEELTLASFLGTEGNDDLSDYYRKELPEEDDAKVWALTVAALSEKRQERYASDPKFAGTKHSDFKKFTPVYYYRRMKEEAGKGNRTPGWFAGARVVRKVADGNPRRFLQIMDALVETAREVELTARYQHRVISDYCKRVLSDSEGLPSYGPLVKATIEKVGKQLAARVHGAEMRDGGCNFRVASAVAIDKTFRQMLEQATAYSIVVADKGTLFNGISEASELRLSYAMAVVFWLPMRKGDEYVLRKAENRLLLPNSPTSSAGMTRKVAEDLLQELDFGDMKSE